MHFVLHLKIVLDDVHSSSDDVSLFDSETGYDDDTNNCDNEDDDHEGDDADYENSHHYDDGTSPLAGLLMLQTQAIDREDWAEVDRIEIAITEVKSGAGRRSTYITFKFS